MSKNNHDFRDKPTVIVVDDFLPDFHELLPELYSYERWDEHSHPDEGAGSWPGTRSRNLVLTNPAMTHIFMREAGKYFGHAALEGSLQTHMRLEKDNAGDGIHSDYGHAVSCIVYLSETNLNSGTVFMTDMPENGGQPMSHVAFVQNRAVFFSAPLFHGSMGNYGDSDDNGRFTLNFFGNYVSECEECS